MFMLMIWFQGIWLPQHGYSFADTPLWAGIYMIPFTLGFVIAGHLRQAVGSLRGPALRHGRDAAGGGDLRPDDDLPANFNYCPSARSCSSPG